jgi:hypothetical protein
MQANQEILIESDPSFYMRFKRSKKIFNPTIEIFYYYRYLNIEVLSPCIEEGFNIIRPITPHEVCLSIFILSLKFFFIVN